MAKEPFFSNYNPDINGILADIPYSRKESLASAISSRIRESIVRGDLPGGYVFPGENEMCAILDVGRSTLREAYSQLQTLGLITRSKNGTFVNSYDSVDTLTYLATVIDISDMEELIQFREIIEVGIVNLAALCCTKEDVENLRAILQEQDEARDDVSKLTEIDYRFHSAMAEISGNKLLQVSLNAVRPRFKGIAHWVFLKQPSHTIDEHKAIVDALEAQDAQAAEEAMKYHLSSIMKTGHENAGKKPSK